MNLCSFTHLYFYLDEFNKQMTYILGFGGNQHFSGLAGSGKLHFCDFCEKLRFPVLAENRVFRFWRKILFFREIAFSSFGEKLHFFRFWREIVFFQSWREIAFLRFWRKIAFFQFLRKIVFSDFCEKSHFLILAGNCGF